MEVGQIIVLSEDLSTPWDIEGIEFITERIVGVYIASKPGELQFAPFEKMHFYAPNKDYIEKNDLINNKTFNFKGEKIEVQDINHIDLMSLIN